MLIVAGATELAAGAEQQRRLADCWAPLGMRPTQVGAQTLTPRGRRPYTLTLLRIDADSASRRPVDAPPLGEWRAASGAQTQSESGGVRLRAATAGYALALTSPVFVAPAAGHYRFALRYRTGTGPIEFGALPENGEKWRRRDVEERRLGAEEELAFWIALDAGERIRLGVSSFYWSPRRLDVTLTSLSALSTPRP
jgi:hypothetical protein